MHGTWEIDLSEGTPSGCRGFSWPLRPRADCPGFLKIALARARQTPINSRPLGRATSLVALLLARQAPRNNPGTEGTASQPPRHRKTRTGEDVPFTAKLPFLHYAFERSATLPFPLKKGPLQILVPPTKLQLRNPDSIKLQGPS